MTEDQHRKWDILIKGVITPIIAVITVLVGIYQYTDGQQKSIEKEYQLRKLERQEKMLETKTALYKETRQILSYLSTHNEFDSQTFKSKKDRFWELYWGDLAAVESDAVEHLMVRFGRYLEQIEEKITREDIDSIQREMQQISLELSRLTEKELDEEQTNLLTKH